tara:strand:+ start:394 stop:3300 length:2907 start_codon:yes stop_codon:yes gene_type:complete
MAQHDYNLINQSGANFRTDLNNALTAIVSNNSGASEPATMFAYELWVDTSNSVMKIRNSGNSAWITLPFSIGTSNSVDINAGTVNGITSLSFSSGSTVASILDEDNLSSDSATALATQQSIKAYVDSQVTAQDLDFQADSGGALSIDLDSETFTLTGGTGIDTAGSGNTVTFSIDSTVATLTGSQTLTNKTIDLDNNTVSNIEVDNLKSGVLDTDLTSVSGSDDTLASAKAIKTYVDAAITAEDLDISDGSNSGSIDLDSETLGLLGGTGVTSALSGNNITFSIGQAVGTSDNVQFGVVTAALTGNVTGQASDISNHSTSDLSEGSNLYFTNERTDDRIAALIQNGTGITWTYDDASGTLTGVVSLSAFNTSQLSESGNLYYTDARARAAISENSAQLSYNSSTGVLTYTQGNSDTVSEGSTNLFYTDARVATKIDSYVNKAFVDALNVVAASTSGNAATATALATTRTFSITGDATASAQDFDGSGNVVLTLTIDNDAVALGTKTTGNYVATIAGTTNEIEVTGSGSETAAVTIGLPDDVTIAGNLTVNGTTTTVNTDTLAVKDPLIKLATDNAGADSVDIGFYGLYDTSGSQDLYAGLFRDANDSGKFKLFKDLQAEPTTTVNTSGTGYAGGTLVATIEGNVTGNVTGQISTLSNHDTDNLSEGSTNLYFTNARARSAISATGDISYNSSTGVISFTASAAPVTSVNSETGAVVLDTGDIAESGNLYYTDARVATKVDSYVNKAFVDNLSVVAASATVLANARTIAGVSFNGSANISLDTSNITEDSSYLYYTDARANSAIDARVTNTFINNLSGVVADTSTALATGRTIGMTGDVVWTSASFDGSGNVTGSATIQADAVEQSMIADDAVGADQLASSSVVTASVVDDAITQAKIAANSVGITELNVSDGSNGQALKTDGSGNLSFGSVSVSQTLTVVGRAANVAITITSGVLGVIARSGTINVGV